MKLKVQCTSKREIFSPKEEDNVTMYRLVSSVFDHQKHGTAWLDGALQIYDQRPNLWAVGEEAELEISIKERAR